MGVIKKLYLKNTRAPVFESLLAEMVSGFPTPHRVAVEDVGKNVFYVYGMDTVNNWQPCSNLMATIRQPYGNHTVTKCQPDGNHIRGKVRRFSGGGEDVEGDY